MFHKWSSIENKTIKSSISNSRVIANCHINNSKADSIPLMKSRTIQSSEILSNTKKKETTPQINLKKVSIQEQTKLKEDYYRIKNIEEALEELKNSKTKLNLSNKQDFNYIENYHKNKENSIIDEKNEMNEESIKNQKKVFNDPDDVDDVIEDLKFDDLINNRKYK